MSIVVPFNYAPVSTTVKTSSYTVPAGKYSRVLANLEGSATLTIDGVTALRGTQNSVLGSSGLITQQQEISGFNGFGASSWNGQVLMAKDGETAGYVNNFGSAAFTSATDQKTTIAELWVPAGTVVSGTGTWRAVVSEYNQIT